MIARQHCLSHMPLGHAIMVLNLARRDFKSAGLKSSWIYIQYIKLSDCENFAINGKI